MTMREEIDRAGPLVDRLNRAIRENPLAAGLIGAGVAWMLFGGTRGIGAAAGFATNVAARTGAAASATTAAGGLAQSGSNAAAAIKDAGSEVVGSVASLVPDVSLPDADKIVEAATHAQSAISEGFDSAVSKASDYTTTIRSRLSEGLESQPLLLGAIGLAIGAGIASTFATTAVESELMGAQGAAARDKLEDLAGDIKDRAGKVLSDVQEEAGRQGLTPERAKDAASDIGDKVKTLAGAGRDAVAKRF